MAEVYYNEIDPKAAAWLRELIKAGELPQGTVDERSIADVEAKDLQGYSTCHFFAGIGGWPLALRLAGWPTARPVWTGSCPCQPFSSAGKGQGEEDPRHLWPQFRRLIATGLPKTILGEQVASKAGRKWLNRVRFDCEKIRYWSEFYKEMYNLQEASTIGGVSEILGKVAGRVEALVQDLPEGIRSRVPAEKQGENQDFQNEEARQRESLSSSVRCGKSWETADSGMQTEVFAPPPSVRPRQARYENREADAEEKVRNDGPSFRHVCKGNFVEQPVAGSHSASLGVYLPQREGYLLWHERGSGELGGVGATEDAQRLAREEWIGDISAISSGFERVVEASVSRLFIAGVRSDLETLGYGVGCADLCAAGLGAPHIRQRLWWVADSKCAERRTQRQPCRGMEGQHSVQQERSEDTDRHSVCSENSGMGNPERGRLQSRNTHRDQTKVTGEGRQARSRVANSSVDNRRSGERSQKTGTREDQERGRGSAVHSAWGHTVYIPCTDGRTRRIEPGITPLVDGLPGRVGLLRGYGNAIMPQLAAEFIAAYLGADSA